MHIYLSYITVKLAKKKIKKIHRPRKYIWYLAFNHFVLLLTQVAAVPSELYSYHSAIQDSNIAVNFFSYFFFKIQIESHTELHCTQETFRYLIIIIIKQCQNIGLQKYFSSHLVGLLKQSKKKVIIIQESFCVCFLFFKFFYKTQNKF